MDIRIDPAAEAAPYRQIVDQVVDAIATGDLVAGERLPSVRHLAAQLGLAVNTAAKAYKLLEAEGHVETLGRNGTVVRGAGAEGRAGEVAAAAQAFVDVAQRHGLDLDATVGVLRRSW